MSGRAQNAPHTLQHVRGLGGGSSAGMAQSQGFEPWVGYQPTHDFQSCAPLHIIRQNKSWLVSWKQMGGDLHRDPRLFGTAHGRVLPVVL